MNTIYEAIVGSKLKGNDTPESDEDTVGIFIASNEEIGGFDWNDSKNVETNESPDGDDYKLYEVRKFFRLAAKSTPAILPFMASHKVIGATFYGQKVLEVGLDLISEEWLRKNANYVRGKFESYLSTGKEKELIEAYYIGELSARWLEQGASPRATLDFYKYYSEYDFREFMSIIQEDQQYALNTLAHRIETMPSHSLLRLKPDMGEAAALLKQIRNNIG